MHIIISHASYQIHQLESAPTAILRKSYILGSCHVKRKINIYKHGSFFKYISFSLNDSIFSIHNLNGRYEKL